MDRLSSYLFRVAGLSAVVAIAVIIAVSSVWDWWNFYSFETNLSPSLRAELDSNGPISKELSNALNDYYVGWQMRLVLPVSTLLGIIVGGFVGMVHSSRLLRPLDAVAAALAALAQGETAVRADAPASKIAEIDSFQRNFNALAQRVERAELDLRDSNAAIAHELRTPLTILIGRLNGIADGIFPMDLENIDMLLTQANQLHRIIDDLTLLTLADAGRFQLSYQDLDLTDLVESILASEPGEIETDLRQIQLRADPIRVRQMLTVLLDNARRYARNIDHSPASGIRVETDIVQDQAVIRVLDRGPGLTAEQADRAFDRYWRANSPLVKSSGGSGLGLAVLRTLAESHNGRVHYSDRPDGGAVFTITLPLNAG